LEKQQIVREIGLVIMKSQNIKTASVIGDSMIIIQNMVLELL